MKAFKDLQPGDIIYYYDHCKMKPLEIVTCDMKETERRYNILGGYKVIIEKVLHITTKTGKPFSLFCTYNDGNFTKSFTNSSRIFSCREAAEEELDRLKEYRRYKIEEAQERLDRYKSIMNKYEII